MASRLLLLQSGGPTAVINASLVGAIETAIASGKFERIVGARNGVDGILSERFVELASLPADLLARLRRTPSSGLGTTRTKLDDETTQTALEILGRHGFTHVGVIGGNDSADTAQRLGSAARAKGQSLGVISIPKTVDNDLPETDHCPGYGSIARFMALATRDAGLDTTSNAKLHPIKLIESMGRDAGWVVASSVLAQDDPSHAPQLLYLPERPPKDLDTFLQEIQSAYDRYGEVVAIISETLRDAGGNPLAGGEARWTDPFGHPYLPDISPLLTQAIGEKLGLRARFDKPGTLARMFELAVSEIDRKEAYEVGSAAVGHLLEGQSEVMVTLVRAANPPYRSTTGTAPLEKIANQVKLLPDEFIGADGRSMTQAFRDYALPLIGEIPAYGRLDDLPPAGI